MSDNNRYFHFTIGPVQGFVAQARRTRDFWAGSFLLSWLAGVAICAVKAQKGKIIFPVPNDNFLNALEGKQVDKLPKQGGIPNRFMADINDCPNFSGQAVVEAVQNAWKAIADAVYKHDEQGLEQQDYYTKQIWDRQIAQFWDMSWVITQGRDTSALDKRKNFRTHVPSVEDGYKCMVMDGFQELSGASDKNSGKKRRQYWTMLSYHIRSKDINEREELCAIAYVKRRFVHVFKNVKTELTVNGNSLTVYGWKLPHNVPSVAYMAAVPWLKEVLSSQNELVISHFKYLVSVLGGMAYMTDADIAGQTEKKNHIQSIQKKIGHDIEKADVSLDGNVYYLNYWDNLNNFVDDKQNYDGRINEHRPVVKSALSKLYKSMNDFEPSPYYAILLMDGDSLGKQMSHEKRQPVISKALDDFTQQAEKIVRQNDGFLIYAGGDDVLALLSLDDAMKTANRLREAYVKCFEHASKIEGENVYSTLSGAINYCHINTPLTQVLKDSHQLLDDIAKDGTGRNALAVRVHKPSGQAVQWSLPWDKVINDKDIETINSILQGKVEGDESSKTQSIFAVEEKESFFVEDGTPVIEALALAMARQKMRENNISIFSSSFFYKIRHLMRMLEQMNFSTDEQASSLLLAEYLQSGQFGKISNGDRERLKKIFKILIEQSKDYKSQIDDGKASVDENSGKEFSGEAGILLRILGQKGLGRGDKA